MNGRGRWLFAIAGLLALVVILAGALLGGPRAAPASPAPSPTLAVPSSTASQTASPTAAPTTPGAAIRQRVYFVRDQLPPVGVDVDTTLKGPQTPESRIRTRFDALATAAAPTGLGNSLASSRTKPTVRDVVIDGDLARIDWNVPSGDWGVGGTAGQIALQQQLVYTATEEPGIRRVMLTEDGGKPTTVMQGHGTAIDRPLAREDVLGYAFVGTETSSIVSEAAQVPTNVVSTKVTNEEIPGLGRFTVEIAGGGSAGGRLIPPFTAKLTESGGKWLLRLDLPDTAAPNPKIPFEQFASGPITSVDSPHTRGPADVGAIFLLGLDDARPWRVSVEPTTAGTTRINVDVGGRPEWVTRNIAVYSLEPGPAARTIIVRGAARVFEASVSWRVRDASRREVARGSTTATIGTSAVWGTFAANVGIPASLTGPGFVDVFWVGPRDGSEQDVVRLPLGVR